jgi:HSP20 family protein
VATLYVPLRSVADLDVDQSPVMGAGIEIMLAQPQDRRLFMADTATKLTVKRDAQQEKQQAPTAVRHPFLSLRREMDRLFDDFDRGIWLTPFHRPLFEIGPAWAANPAVDIAENEKAFEITAELPGLDEKDVEVKVANGGVTIKGSKTEEKEEKNKNYHLQERRFGSFQRYFTIPDGVDADKIEATFKKGVLTVTMLKKPEAQKAEKKIEIKAA